jgi:ketosteroid isomerase-like protein
LLLWFPTTSATDPSTLETEVERIVRERLTAAQKGDIDTWKKHISPDCVWTGPGLGMPTTAGAEAEQRAGAALPAHPPNELSHLQVRLFGDTAIATYIMLERRPDGRAGKQFRKTETLVRREGEWTLVAAVESFVPFREPVAIDPKALDAYSGRYQLNLQHVLRVWREGGRLLSQEDGEREPTELFPSGNDTFFDSSQMGDWTFGRGAGGKVDRLVFKMGASEVLLRRTKN